MTPGELDRDVLHARLSRMRDLLDDLESVKDVTVERLERDRMTRHAVERILSRLVDLAVSVNGHVAAATLGRGPADYRESFALAARSGAISQDLADELEPSAGLRNVLVHDYVSIDLAAVAKSVPVVLVGYRRFVAEVSRFLTEPASRT